MNSVEVLKLVITTNRMEKDFLQFISHPVGVNWRQRHQTTEARIGDVQEALLQNEPVEVWFVRGKDVLSGAFDVSSLPVSENQVISACSIVHRTNESCLHIPMMNFHPDEGVTLNHLVTLTRKIGPKGRGFIMETGRFWHYWGTELMNENEWLRFNCQFLMPTVAVSERYVGHSLYRGYNTLRLTSSAPYKPKTPCVIMQLE